MKTIFVNGSSRVNGTTMQAVKRMQKISSVEGVESEVIQLDNQPIRDCIQYGYYGMHDACVSRDDAMNQFTAFTKEADSFVFATPACYAHLSGRILALLDRALYSVQDAENPFAFKPGASIAVARRGDTTASLDALDKYFRISQMPVAGSTYWNISHGLTAEDAVKDEEGMQTMRNLTRNMVWMMRNFALAKKQGIPYPEAEGEAVTNFIQREDWVVYYGVQQEKLEM